MICLDLHIHHLVTAFLSSNSSWHLLAISSVQSAQGYRALDPATPFTTFPSAIISFSEGTGIFGIANRGLGNHGYALKAGASYDGYFYAKGIPGTTVSISVSFADTNTGALLDQGVIQFTAPAEDVWTKLNFTLTPAASTNCVGIAPGSDPNIDCGNIPDPSYLCVSCNGEFQIGLQSPGQVNIAYVFLEPGTWGRVGNLPVLMEPVQWLLDMGITAIRSDALKTALCIMYRSR